MKILFGLSEEIIEEAFFEKIRTYFPHSHSNLEAFVLVLYLLMFNFPHSVSCIHKRYLCIFSGVMLVLLTVWYLFCYLVFFAGLSNAFFWYAKFTERGRFM